ncbi:hypothetical protein BaRGS_00005677 [Batillaria attramentaria]|uniref:Uncharacterized protein n=1 Tax=Batillaria attramentaria TaxID=370345 RepID=A0ABD0LU66_9CAEN
MSSAPLMRFDSGYLSIVDVSRIPSRDGGNRKTKILSHAMVNGKTKRFFCGMETTEAEIMARCIESPKMKKDNYCFDDGTAICGYCNAKAFACL